MRSPVFTSLATMLACLLVVSLPSVAQQSSSIRVTVVDHHGAAVPAAQVHIVSLPDLIGLPTPNGTFSFKNVTPGTYQISATSAKKQPEARDFTESLTTRMTEKQISSAQKLALQWTQEHPLDPESSQTLDHIVYNKP